MKTKINKKRAYLLNIPFLSGEATVVTSDSAEDIMVHSSRLAECAQKAGLSTLLINCGMSKNRFMDHFIENHDVTLGFPHLILKSSVRGELINESEDIRQALDEGRIGIVVLAGWEWASNSWRKKQRLLYFLREIMEDYNVAVIIYSSKYNSPEAGKIDRGGLGDLAYMSMFVVAIDCSEQLEKDLPKPPILVVGDYEEQEAMERSAQLLLSKVNELQAENQKITSSWDITPPDEEEALVEV